MKFIWVCFVEALGWERAPRCLQDFLDNWIPIECPVYNLKFFLLATVMWGLWTVRNKRAIENKIPRNPCDIMLRINMFLQRWKIRLRDEDKLKLGEMESRTHRWMEDFLEKLKDQPPEDSFL